MKRRRPQWQSMCTMLTVIISGTVLVMYSSVSGEAYEGEMQRKLQTVPPVLQPIPPPLEVNVTSSPTFAPIDPGCGGCPPPGTETPPEPTDFPMVSTRKPTESIPTSGPSLPTTDPPIVPGLPQPVELPTSQPAVSPTPPPLVPETPTFVEPPSAPPMDPPTSPPVEPPVSQPEEPPTRQPIQTQAPQPPPTAPPMDPPTSSTVEPPVSQPVEPPTRQPVQTQTPQPGVESPISAPIDSPGQSPVQEPQTPRPVETRPPIMPVESPTLEPTVAPVVSTLAPVVTTSAPTTSPSMLTTTGPVSPPTLPQLSKPPTSTIEEVPIVPFVLSLGFDQPQSGTAEDLEVLTSEVNRILSDYLYDVLNASITDESVVLEDVALTVIPQLGRSDALFKERRALRALQDQDVVVDFSVSGNAIYEVGGDSNVTPQELTQQTNEVVVTTMEDPQTQQDLTEEFQASEESEVLSNTTGVSAKVEAPPSDDGSDKPTTVAIVFGWLLVGLGVVGIGMYASAFIKKRRKRARQRKRDRERGLGESYNNAPDPTASMASMNRSISHSQSAESKVMVLPPTEYIDSESESDSDADSTSPSNSVVSPVSTSAASAAASTVSSAFSGLESDASTKSDFTRELELAASLDKRSWSEMQKERSAGEDESRSIQYPSQYAVEGTGTTRGVPADESPAVGAAVAGVATATLAAAAIKSYPYGDESNSEDESVDLSKAKATTGDDLFGENDDGIEWTEEGVWSPYDGYQKRESMPEQSTVSSITDSRSDKQRSVWAKSWSSIDSFRRSRKRETKDPNAFLKSWSSIDSARESAPPKQTSRNMTDASLVKDTVVEEVVEEATEHAAVAEEIESRAVDTTPTVETAPTVSSAGTTNAVRASPPPSELPAEGIVVSEKAIVEENKNNDDDSVLIQDIVKEVHRLARFVRKYDKKRERKLLKDREREEKAVLAINEAQSVPSVGYDAMSDSISAPRKVETSTRRERTALTNPVEETDESVDSERSWSTTSNANAPFHDEDDVSAPETIDDSEIDVSNSSVGDPSETESNASRLGITPYSVQRIIGRPQSVNPVQQPKKLDTASPETARPPVTNPDKSRGLPPSSTAPGSPDEELSPEKTHTPVQSVKQAMMRVYSARQQKFGRKSNREQSPRDSELTEDALQELADGNVETVGRSSPYHKQKDGALATLRKNEAILDTASSHFTEGLTSSQYEQAFRVGVVTQQEQRKAYLTRNSFKREAQDPPAQVAESMSLQASDEKRSPPWESKAKETAVEMRVPPTQPPRPITPPVRNSAGLTTAPPSASTARRTQPLPTQRRAPFRVQSATTTRSPQLRNSLSPVSTSSGTKRAAPEAAPEPQTPSRQESTTAPISPAIQSPPRRKTKRGSAFNNVVNMFEQKPKNAIFPPGEGWQYSY